LDATNAITGNSGGYVIMRDSNEDGKPDEILIMDSEDITQATKVWRWNKEGLGFAEQAAGNAYLGPYRTAITADGKINADFIVTGTLNADLIRVGDEKFGDYISITDGVIRFGNTDDQMSLKLGNVEVDGEKTYQLAFFSGDTRIAYFSNNSFEIENLTEGKIRFQNFGFIPRASGNLSFTKLI
jgi:phage-related protein